MLHIHNRIQTGKFPNANTLARELEVTARTIGRDVEFMRERMELPIRYDPVKHGFHYDGEVSAFPTLTISEGELFALAVAEKALQQYRGTTFERPLLSALKKVSQSLPDAVSLNLDDWNDSISFKTSAESVLDLEVFDRLSKSISRREELRIRYRKPGQREAEERVIHPYHLANVNGDWFLFAHDRLRGAIRTFVPARILSAEKTGTTFKKDPKFSVAVELQNSFGVYSGGPNVKVVLRFAERIADYIREKKWHPSQKLRQLKGGELEMQMTLSSLVEVERWILAWGGYARAIEPRALVESLKHAATRLSKAHGSGDQDSKSGSS